MPNYNTYIELSPDYESVVDINSENRNPDMWKQYIVHEDMKELLELICRALSFEDTEYRRSFWIHGAYGTGKTYVAIVLKHLFEDSIENIQPFLSNQMLIPYRDTFLAQRKKGKYLVIWKNQTTDIKNGTQLMMAIELAIREKLSEEFGKEAYYGRNSLISASKEAINKTTINWQEIFDNSPLGLYDEYETLEDFKAEVEEGSLKACNYVARIFRENGWGFFTVVSDFEKWLKDIIEGNHLQDTGIILIWDEFTTYLRDNPNDDVLQPLSEYCKEQPFFMFLIVHKDPSWLSSIGEEEYERIMDRYNHVEFSVSESAAYELIGNSILTRAGMETQWDSIKNKLMDTISKNIADFDNLDLSSSRERFRQLCPLHPMTLSMLAIVAENFGASQRTLFRFMKDRYESTQNVGFIYYINNYSYDNWRWLTPDFLWDYFFMRESDIRNFSPEAKSAYQHFITKKEYISDEYIMHIFKAAMLLIAVMSSGNVSNLYSRAANRKISATKSTLYKCFSGVLEPEDVDNYLNGLVEIGLLRLDNMTNGDARLQIPYSGASGDVFEYKKDDIRKKYTRYELFKKSGTFSTAIEKKIISPTDALYNRMYVAAACSETSSINNRLDEIKKELDRYQYKFGLLIIAIDEESTFIPMQEKVKELALNDKTGRFAVCLLKTPLTEDDLDNWYNEKTHTTLASDEGKSADAEQHSEAAAVVVSGWAESAGDNSIMVACGTRIYPNEYGAYSLIQDLKKDVILGSVFTAAPEKIVITNTVFKKMQASIPEYGIRKEAPNTQILSIENALKSCDIWEAASLNDIAQCSGSSIADAVSAVARFILQKFAQGSQIKLDEMWLELQRPPYGYYNNIICGYILGFLLRFYVNSEFSWNKGDNNPWPFTEKNIATMIKEMCEGKTLNHYLSPGSEVWQKFKPYVQKVFKLSDNEAVNETEARKYISKQCTENAGVPFWAIKYAPEEKFGGEMQKEVACDIIDLFCAFMLNEGDQEALMSNIIDKFTGQGKIRNTLTELYFDQNVAYAAFNNFIAQRQNKIPILQQEIGLTNQDIFDAIRQMMQGEVSTWTESEVESKLDELCLEYNAVLALNKALDKKQKSIQQLSDDIKHAFSHMTIPGSVIETMGYDWIPTLKAMHAISETQWSKIEITDRKNYTNLISNNASVVWGNVTSAMGILKNYLERHGNHCSEEELKQIYTSLSTSEYNASITDFENKLSTQLNKIAYNRNKTRINELWHERSGFTSVKDWCDYYAVPIQWVVTDEEEGHIAILYSIQNEGMVDSVALQNATLYFENHALSILKNKAEIKNSFFANIGERYKDIFEKFENVLVSRLKTDRKLTSNVYSWSNKVGKIQDVINEFLRIKYSEEAKKNVLIMNEETLREKVITLLDENPDLYTTFIK